MMISMLRIRMGFEGFGRPARGGGGGRRGEERKQSDF